MICLTICQPYPELILRGRKRVENRTWFTRHRGAMLIHAGLSRKWLRVHPGAASSIEEIDADYGLPIPSLPFGAIVGVVDILDCLPVAEIIMGKHEDRFPRLMDHEHVGGPWCFVLENPRRFRQPICYRGRQGFFDVPTDVVREALAAA